MVNGTSGEYFDRMWRDDDPWDQADRFSEHRKYDITVSALPSVRYRRAFEPGCATGVLTEKLATRCDHLVATDRHPRAVTLASRRTSHLSNVTAAAGRIPDDMPDGPFDLIVFSEVLYYLTEADVMAAITRAAHAMSFGGHLVAVHYRPLVPEHELLGDEVHALLRRAPGWRHLVEHRERDFVLDILERS